MPQHCHICKHAMHDCRNKSVQFTVLCGDGRDNENDQFNIDTLFYLWTIYGDSILVS